MKLSDFSPEFYDTRREGTFCSLANFSSAPPNDSLTFCEDSSYLTRISKRSDLTCVICTEELSSNETLLNSGKGIAVSSNPRRAFYELHNHISKKDSTYGLSGEQTVIGNNCIIHPTAVISKTDVIIGNNVVIEENVVVKPGSIIEDNAFICTGAIIAGESQIITRDINGNQFLIKQLGKCRICKNAVIGYHTMIARGTFPYDETVIGEYTMVENSVEISHNSHIGKNCIITGQCQVCGNSVVGDNTRLNPQALISNRIKVGSNSTVELGSVVVSNIGDNKKVAGNFAIDHMKFLLWHRKKLSGR